MQQGTGTFVAGDTTYYNGFLIIDVKYVGNDTSIDLDYIKDPANSSFWDNPDATRVFAANDNGHAHFWTSTLTNDQVNTCPLDLKRYCNVLEGHFMYSKTNRYWARLIEKC